MILKGHSDDITSVDISKDNRRIVSGSDDDSLRIWDLRSGKLIRSIKHTRNVTCVVFTPDAKKVVAGSYGQLTVWDVSGD